MRIFRYLCRSYIALMYVLCCLNALPVSAEESGLMLCTDNIKKSGSYIVFQPDLLDTQRPCDDNNKWQVTAGSNLTTLYGQCSSVNIACLAELSPGFEQTINQIQLLDESGQVPPVTLIPMARNAGVMQRAGAATLAFLISSQIYQFLYSGSGFYDTLTLSLLAAGLAFLFPQAPAYLWSFLGQQEADMSTNPAHASDTPLGTENYGGSSNTYFGEPAKDGGKRLSKVGGNVHKLSDQ